MGEGRAELPCPGIGYAICWTLLVIFLAWPLAFLVIPVYILVMPFAPCSETCKNLDDALYDAIIKLPYRFGENAFNMKGLN